MTIDSRTRRFIEKQEKNRFNPYTLEYGWTTKGFTVEEGHEIVGYGNLRLSEKPISKMTAELALLVDAPHRDQGIGSKLMKSMIAYAQDHGIKKIWLRCYEDNIPALKLYTKFGFKVEGRFEKQEWEDGRPLTVLSLALLL